MELKLSSKRRYFVKVSEDIKDLLGERKENERLKRSSYDCLRVKDKAMDFAYFEESIDDYIIDDSEALTFSKLVKKIMEEKGITSKDIYRNSLINRKLFSALNVNDEYVPSRETAIMYCIALKLNYNESSNLMKTAGYSFYEYSNFDRVIKYFLDNKIYNIDKINDALYYYTNKCLGYR